MSDRPSRSIDSYLCDHHLEELIKEVREIRIRFGNEAACGDRYYALERGNLFFSLSEKTSNHTKIAVKQSLSMLLDIQNDKQELEYQSKLVQQKLQYLLTTLAEDKVDDTTIPQLFDFLGHSIQYAVCREKQLIYNHNLDEHTIKIASKRTEIKRVHSCAISEGMLFVCQCGDYEGYFLRHVPFDDLEKSIIEIQLNMLDKHYRQNRLHELISDLNQLYISEFSLDLASQKDDTIAHFKSNFGSLLNSALKDSLTQTYNRNKTSELIRKFCEEKKPLSVLLVDIDYFKSINDTYGHIVGDKVLVEVVECLRLEMREEDILSRWGGEEFLILIKDDDKSRLLKLSERLRRAVELTTISNDIKVTVSIGLSIIKDVDNPDDLIQRADDALYEAKRSGRNTVVLLR